MYTKNEIFEQHIDYLRKYCKNFFIKAYPDENDKDTFKYIFVIKKGKPKDCFQETCPLFNPENPKCYDRRCKGRISSPP